MDQELAEKTERVVRMLAAEGLGGVIIGSQANFSWLSCGGTSGIDQSREPGVGYILVRRDGRRFLLANRIEMPRLLAEEVNERDFEPVEFGWEEDRASSAFIAHCAQRILGNGTALGSDLPVDSAARFIDGALARLRYRLTDGEIERYRALGRDIGEALGRMARAIEPGLTEQEIARRAGDAVAACGARAVVNLVAADERLARFRHPVPTGKRWKKTVLIVICARRYGLTVSLSRIVCAGAIPDDLTYRTRATAAVNAQLFAATRPGATGRELYETAARAYAGQGFPGEERLHHQGGAIGYRTRDWVAHPASAEMVQARQAFAWNPSITGTKTEETCIAFDDAIEVVTPSPGWPQIRIEISGREYALPDVLSL
jgi:antitoxin VapB